MVDQQLCACYEVFDLTWNFVMSKSNNPTTSEDLNESRLYIFIHRSYPKLAYGSIYTDRVRLKYKT